MRLFLLLFLLFSISLGAQEDFLAKQYFADGDFEKALVFYEKLTEKNPRRTDYQQGLISCYQQLERYADVEEFLLKQLKQRNPHPSLFIELGYNYTLQEMPDKANEYYTQALQIIEQNPNYGYALGYQFQKYSLLDKAVLAYTKAMDLNPALDYSFQLARLYGEQGNIDKMYRSYLDLIGNGKTSKSNILRNIDDFITADPENYNNTLLKQILLEKAQKTPEIVWNELLSWLFVQQEQYSSAFRQEKAIYKRVDGSTTVRLENLAQTALDEEETEIAREIFNYVVKETGDEVTRLEANLNLLDIELLESTKSDYPSIQKKYEELIDTYGYRTQTLQLQVAYAKFLTFKKDSPELAIKLLKNSLELPLNDRGTAYLKLTLGDILVYDRKFNEALIYFSQIQKN